MKTQIDRSTFYRLGGFSNTKLYRKMKGSSWQYWLISDKI